MSSNQLSCHTASSVLRSVLRHVRQGWLQYGLAVDADGRPCPAWHPSAVAWTLLGAINAAEGPDKLKHGVIGKMRLRMRKLSFADWNADATVQDVVALIQSCIEDGVLE